MKETFVLTWWFARQLIAGDAITGRPLDWQMEAATADGIHTAQSTSGSGEFHRRSRVSIHLFWCSKRRSGGNCTRISAYDEDEKHIHGIGFSVAAE